MYAGKAFEWSEESIERLKVLRAKGLSFRQIGDAMGVTRNSALGKFHRMGFVDFVRPATPKRATTPRPARAPKPPPQPKPAKHKLLPQKERLRLVAEAKDKGLPAPTFSTPARFVDPAIAEAPRPWMTRAFEECAYPVDGEGEAVRSCCNPVEAGSVYCSLHRKACCCGYGQQLKAWGGSGVI